MNSDKHYYFKYLKYKNKYLKQGGSVDIIDPASDLASTIIGRCKDICEVCLSNDEKLDYLTLCGHCFHKECIKPWILNKETCPICRIYLDDNHIDIFPNGLTKDEISIKLKDIDTLIFNYKDLNKEYNDRIILLNSQKLSMINTDITTLSDEEQISQLRKRIKDIDEEIDFYEKAIEENKTKITNLFIIADNADIFFLKT